MDRARIALALMLAVVPVANGQPTQDDQRVRLEPIAIGGPPTYQWFDFDVPSIDAVGNVAFAHPAGHIAVQSEQLYSWDGQNITLALSTGDPLGGVPGVQHAPGGFNACAAGAGAICVYDNIAPSPYSNAISVGPRQALRALVWDGSGIQLPAPGVPGATFQYAPRYAAINQRGEVAFDALMSAAPSPPYGVWAGPPTSLRLIARGGAQAPGLPQGLVFRHSGDGTPFSPPQINEQGQVLFVAGAAAGPNQPETQGFWLADPNGPLRLVVASGDPAPGLAPGTVFRFLGPTHLTDTGEVVFTASVQRGDREHEGVFIGRPGLLRAAALPGQTIKMPDGTRGTFNVIGSPIGFNSQGAFVAAAHIGPGPESPWSGWALIAGEAGALRVVAELGAPAAGSAPGTTYDYIPSFDPLYQPQLGADGRFAVRIQLRHADGRRADAVFASGRDGILRLVAEEGQPVQVECGLTRFPAQVYSSHYAVEIPTGAGRRRSMSDSGRLCLYMWFGSYGGVVAADVDRAWCDADFDCDGVVSPLDVAAFLNAYAVHDPRADLNHDNQWSPEDLSIFVERYTRGCGS
jgi:hypothetical protein